MPKAQKDVLADASNSTSSAADSSATATDATMSATASMSGMHMNKMKNEPYLTLALHIQLLSLPIPALLAAAQPSWLHPPCPPSQPVVWQEERLLDPALLKITLTVQTQVDPVNKLSLAGL